MADISSNISKSIQGLSNIPAGDLAAGVQQFADALAAGSETIKDNNVTGRQYNQILKAQSDANARFIKDERRRFKNEKKRYREENTLWQRLTKQNKEHLKAQKEMIKGMKTANRELTMYGRAQSKLMSGLQRGAGAAGAGIIKLAGKAGALGLVVVALKTLVDKILEADQILVNMSKSTGQFRDALRPTADAASLVANKLAMAGVSMKEVTEASLGFLNNLTNTNRDYSKFLGTATMVSKAFGIGAEQSSKFFATIAETTTISGENMEKMVDDIVAFGATGTNVARVMRDMTANSNLIAVYGGQQVDNLVKMAKYAADSGTDLQSMRSTMEALGSDFDTAISLVQELNVRFNTNIDSAEAYQVAFSNNAEDQTAWYQKTIAQLADATKLGEAFTSVQLKAMGAMHIDPKQVVLAQLLNLRRKQGLDADQQAQLRQLKGEMKLRDLVRDQQTMWEKIKGIIAGPITVFLRNMGEYLEKNINPILDRLAIKMDMLFDGEKLKKQVEAGDFTGALKTAFAPIGTILKDAMKEALDYVVDNYEFDLLDGGFKRKLSSSIAEINEKTKQLADERQKLNKLQKLKIYMDTGKAYSPQRRNLQKQIADDLAAKVESERKLKKIEEKIAAATTKEKQKELNKQLKVVREKLKEESEAYDASKLALTRWDMELQSTIQTVDDLSESLVELRKKNDLMGPEMTPENLKRIAEFLKTEEGMESAIELANLKGAEYELAQMRILEKINKTIVDNSSNNNIDLSGSSGVDETIVAPLALGSAGFRGPAIVGEAGGEVVASRSALRSGIGIGGRAASALAGIGVPGFANGFTRTYAADTSGTRDSDYTWRSGRDIRGQLGAAASEAQNKPLREFQESVYQFRLSTIEYGEYMRSNIQQQRRLPFLLVQAIERGIQIVGHKLMGESGQKMFEFGKGNEALKYMNMFNKIGTKGTLQAIGQGFVGQLGYAATGKYVNSPTLMMVGEEGRGEVVIPTERIRKGLPINAGVARELASIGVPGFDKGGETSRAADDAFERLDAAQEIMKERGLEGGSMTFHCAEAVAFGNEIDARVVENREAERKAAEPKPTVSTTSAPAAKPTVSTTTDDFDLGWEPPPKLSIKEIEPEASWAGAGPTPGAPIADDVHSILERDIAEDPLGGGDVLKLGTGFFGSRYGKGSDFQAAGGFSGVGRASLGAGAMQGLSTAFNVWQQGGTSEQIMASGLSSALGTGVGIGASALLAPVLGPFAPMVGGFIGSQVGKFAGKWLGKKLGANDPKFGKYRKQAMQLMKTHVRNRMPFEPGIPHGLAKKMHMGIAGRFGKPTNKSQTDMRNALMKNFPNLSNRESIAFINMMLGSESNPKAYAYFNKDFGLPTAMEFAEGGVVNKPTNAIIGEAGPEAVVPLENSELVKEMKEIRKATQQLVKIIGDGKTTINLDGRILAESTGLQMYDIAQGM